MFKTKEELLTVVLKAIPYSNQIIVLDSSKEETAIRIKWRTKKYRITLNGDVDEIDIGVIIGSDISILFRELLRRQWVSMQFT